MGTGTASAAPPTPNDPSTFQLDCPGFQVDAQATDSSKVIEQFHHFRDAKPLKLFTDTSSASTITLTGPAPASKVVRYVANGTIRVALDFRVGDLVYTATGRNLISVPKHEDFAGGVFLTVGRVTWTLNGPVFPNGGLVGPGTVTDICPLLGP